MQERLGLIFPQESDLHANCTSIPASRDVLTMLYTGAIAGSEYDVQLNDGWSQVAINPAHVTRMSDAQVQNLDPNARKSWAQPRGFSAYHEDCWYKDNSREGVRDDALTNGLRIPNAVFERPGLATTSSKPRYWLDAEFAALFDPRRTGSKLKTAIESWQSSHLTAAQLARLKLARRTHPSGDSLLVGLPGGHTRRVNNDDSGRLAKTFLEDFCARFLTDVRLIFASDSRTKQDPTELALARNLDINVSVDRGLPDIIVADVGADPPVIVFAEMVHTDGAITEKRRQELRELAPAYDEASLWFVSVFHDRSHAAYNANHKKLAWNTWAWFESEPDAVMKLEQQASS